VTVKIDNGTITGSNGQYTANPATRGKALISVYTKDGKMVKEAYFRVKVCPDPVAKIAGIKNSGKISKATLLAQNEVIAEMENFDFDLNFRVVSFTLSTIDKGYTFDRISQSNKFTEEQRNQLQKVQPGDKVFIDDIKAIGPDGTIRQLGNIALTIE